MLSVVHLGLQLVCVTVDVAEAGNKMSLTPNFRSDHGKISPQFSGVPRCRATCRIPHRESRHSRKSRLNTLCTLPRIAIINSQAILMRRRKEGGRMIFLYAYKSCSRSSINFQYTSNNKKYYYRIICYKDNFIIFINIVVRYQYFIK